MEYYSPDTSTIWKRINCMRFQSYNNVQFHVITESNRYNNIVSGVVHTVNKENKTMHLVVAYKR